MELLDAPFDQLFDVGRAPETFVAAAASAAPTEVDGVAVVRWPEDAARATELARIGTPRLYLVAPDAEPPDLSGDEPAGEPTHGEPRKGLSAWVRLPAHERDVQARIVELRGRASLARPILGDHGLLWRGSQWVALSPIEARLTEAFVARPGRVLSRARLERTGWPDGTPNERSVDARIKALRRRISPIGMRIHTVRGQGYIAEIQPAPAG